METYHVPVRNEDTGEVRVVGVLSEFKKDAQIEALCKLFHDEGWRKAIALEPYADSAEATA